MLDFEHLEDEYRRLVALQLENLAKEEAAFRAAYKKRQKKKARAQMVAWRAPMQYRKVAYGVLGFVAATLMVLFVIVLYIPQTLTFSYAQSAACVTSPAFFPSVNHDDGKTAFRLNRPATVSLGHTAIFSDKLCVHLVSTPSPSTTIKDMQVTSIFGLSTTKPVRIKTGSYPGVQIDKLSAAQTKALPLLKPLIFNLGAADQTFSYSLAEGSKSTPCNKQKTQLSCNLTGLQLGYGAGYTLRVMRQFQSDPASQAFAAQVQTITATGIAQTSIAAGATVYDTPQQVVLTTTKPLHSVDTVSLTYQANGKTQTIPTTQVFKGATITVSFKQSLPRETTLTLQLSDVTATDQSQLEQPYSLAFTTSGGPKVTGVNIPKTGVAAQPAITVTFDQVLLPNQNLQALLSLTVNGASQPGTYSARGNQITVTPQAAFPLCAHISVATTNAVQSQYGISGNSAWSYAARSICYTTYNIGASAQGRGITAYQFGNGAETILYIGAMHGNEQNSMVILQKWIAALNVNPDRIPTKDTVIVIPAINPDGVALNTRVNANGIDLNRNFPTKDWQTQVTEPTSNGALTNAGGPSSFSEPESNALGAFFIAKKPRLTLSYHSHAGVVEANDAADSDAIGTAYASMSAYRAIPTYAIGNTFDYSTTGAFEDWANQKFGLPVLVVELQSATADEFSRNQAAMWQMTQY